MTATESTSISGGALRLESGEPIKDPAFLISDSKVIHLPSLSPGGAKRPFLQPFGVVMGGNISGESRGVEALNDKAMRASIKELGVQTTVQVKPIIVLDEHDKPHRVYALISGNRRTSILRDMLAKGEIEEELVDDSGGACANRKALIPIEEAEELHIAGISSDEAHNLRENSMRKIIDPIDKAHAIFKLRNPPPGAPRATAAEMALVLTGPEGKPLGDSTIRAYLRLLKLHPSLQTAVRKGVMRFSLAATLADDPPEEQIATLQAIMDAQTRSSNKTTAAEEVVKKRKQAKRKDADGEVIHREPMSGKDIRETLKDLTAIDQWDCLPKTSKLNHAGYEIIVAIMKDLHTFCDGGLTPKNVKPEELTLPLKTRILDYLSSVAHR
jgi:hypothetical protein